MTKISKVSYTQMMSSPSRVLGNKLMQLKNRSQTIAIIWKKKHVVYLGVDSFIALPHFSFTHFQDYSKN